jgi:hypothetical protein
LNFRDEGVCGIRLEEIGTWWLGECRLAEFVGPRFGMAVLGPPSLVGVGGTTLEVMRGRAWPAIAGGKLGNVIENLVLCAGALIIDVGI